MRRARRVGLVLALAAVLLGCPVPGPRAQARDGLAPTARLEAPVPPPVDPDALPGDARPTATEGVTQDLPCAGPTHVPGPAARAGLLWGQRWFDPARLGTLSPPRRVRIAVIDTGVARHPLLAGRLVGGGDYVAGGTGTADCDGHGTAVAGIAAAAADQDTGFTGIDPRAEIISIRQSSPRFSVPGADGSRRAAGNLDTLARAVVHAVELGASVINISEVACAAPDAPGSAELHAAVHLAATRDVVVVAAAGNTGAAPPRGIGPDASGSGSESGPDSGSGSGGVDGDCPADPGRAEDTVVYPGWFDDDVLTVAAVGPDGAVSAFSYPGPWVDVAAPGQRLLSLSAAGPGLTDQLTGPRPAAGGTSGVGSWGVDGTSFAAPMVAGLAALVRARHPELTAREVVDRIVATARGAPGRDPGTGYGMVDPVAALTRPPTVLPAPGASPVEAGIGRLPLPSAGPARPGDGPGGALWGGALGILAAALTMTLAVGRARIPAGPPAGRGPSRAEHPAATSDRP